MESQRPIHERVKEQVDDAGFSVAELAKETGWDEQRVYRLLTGRTKLTAEDIETLAKILNKTVIALYRGKAAS